MKKYTSQRASLILFGLVSLCILLTTQLSPLTSADEPASPPEIVARAWQLAQDSSRYAFDSQIEQTTYPIPSLTNAGRLPEEQKISLTAQVDKVAQTSAITFWQGDPGLPEQGMMIRTENGRSQQRLSNGEWETLQQNTDFFAPDNDPLTFLQVATNIQDAGIETLQLSEKSLNYTVYTFDIDTDKYSQMMRQQLEQHLAQYGRLPDNLTLDTAKLYQGMTGTGHLWLNADGLPSHLELNLDIPAQAEAGRTTAILNSDFHSYDRRRIAQANFTFWQNPPDWWEFHQTSIMNGVRQTAVPLTLMLLITAFFMLVLPYRETKGFQTAVTLFIITSILTSPLLQSYQAQAFHNNLSTARANQEAKQTQNEQINTTHEQLQQTNFDPHLSPSKQLPNSKQLSVSSLQSPIPSLQSPNLSISQSPLSPTDTDNDGLTDDDELLWGTCAYLGAPEYCDGVTDAADSDGDGIKDGIEVYNLTTHPAHWDSDGDTITDTLEINGFNYNGQMWYLNPNESDSNKDGLTDSLECLVWTAISDYDPNAACPDTDSDGIPDVWDDDNDDDGVLDATDLSPFDKVNQLYSHDNPMTLQIDNLQSDLPVFVDVQFRPTNPDHLNYIGTVLNWPTGDTQGQIQRRLNTTFANTANLDIRATDSLARNGDVRLVPIVEMLIPYTPGHYGNLPILPAYQGSSRTLGVPVEDWLDTSKLQPYGINVDDAPDGSGDLIVSLPLTAVTDDTGGGRSAYAFRMLYWPEQNNGSGAVNWAAPHEYRVQWFVQMITDECVEPTAEPETCTRQDSLDIIHVYQEEWKVTGISIREDHAYDVAILYEDPIQDSNPALDDDLWAISWNLNNQFLRGRDCDSLIANVCQGDGQRDVTVANLDLKITEWSTGTDSIEVSTFNYDHHGFMAHIMMTETMDLLDTVFTPSGINIATLMFASEETYRSSNLGVAANNSGALTFDLLDVPVFTSANLSWSPYQLKGNTWRNADPVQYLSKLRQQLSNLDPYFQPADNSPASRQEAEGKLIWVELYYIVLYQGLSARVAVENDLLWTESYGGIPEYKYEALWAPSTFSGASTIAVTYLSVLSEVFKYGDAAPNFWTNLSDGFSKSYTTEAINRQFSGFQTANNVLFAATSVMAIVGFTLFTVGFFSGDAKLQRAGEIILNVTTAVLVSVTIVNYLVAFQVADAAGRITSLSSAFSFSWQQNAVGGVGLLFQIAIAWGAFLFSAISAGVLNNPGSITFNMLLAYAIAQTIVAIIFFVITLIPLVGNLIVLVVILAEAILSFFGYQGAQGWLTEVIAESLYDVDFIIRNLDSPDRLKFNFIDMTMTNEEAGFTIDQSILYSMDVTNTVQYAGGYGAGAAKKATFRYFLQGTDSDRHLPLALNQMNDEWYGVNGNRIETQTTVALQGGSISFADVGAGLNRNLGGRLYLTEAYVAPYVGCWQVFGEDVNCHTYPYSGSVHIDVGEFSVFDILPNTLSEFYHLGWNKSDVPGWVPFPNQRDQDGDGLVLGTDPTPTSWDGDGDGLTDYYELANGLDPLSADADGDGLTDRKEIVLGFNPYKADMDGDGLSDLQEWEGWQVVYDYDDAGNPLLTWAWPDPYVPDVDNDSLTDQEEQFYALHPRLASNKDAILDTIQFSDGTVTEQAAPAMLLRFDEEVDATSFLDNALGELATCVDDSCPVAGENGRYNAALLFDGTNDYLRAPFVLDPAAISFTAAVWFNVSNIGTTQNILQQEDGTGAAGRSWFYINPSGKVATYLAGSALTGSQIVTANEWHHIAISYDGVTLSLYLDGQLENSANRTVESSDGDMLIGIHKSLNQNRFAGLIDEVIIYSTAHDQASIAAIAAARYNVGDLVVAPGDTLDFQMTVSNTNSIYPAKVVYYGEADGVQYSEFQAPPYRMFMDETAGTTFAISGTTGVATCNNGVGACPVRGVGGIQNSAFYFDGNDEINADTIIENFDGQGWTAAFWIYPEPLPTGPRNQTLLAVLDDNGGTNRSDFRFLLGYDQQNQECCGYPGEPYPKILPNTWYHIAVSFDNTNKTIQLYVDGVQTARYVHNNNYNATILRAGDRLQIGGPIPTDLGTFTGWEGRIDDFIFYDRVLSDANVQSLYTGGTPEFPLLPEADIYNVPTQNSTDLTDSFTVPSNQPSGGFTYSQLAEAALNIPDLPTVALDPVRRAHFDEAISSSATHKFLARYPTGTSISCNQNFCPAHVNDFAGEAVEFNGVDSFMSDSSPILNGPWAMSIWVKPTHVGSSTQAIIGNRNGNDTGFPSLFITPDDKLGFAFYDGTSWNTNYTPGGTIPRHQWSQVAVTYDGAGNYQTYVNGTAVGNGAPIQGITPVVNTTVNIGRIGTGYNYFQGRLDNYTLYDVELNASDIAGLYSSDDLSLHLHYTLDEPPGNNTFVDQAGIFGDGTCGNCPALGIRGPVNRAAYFDNNLIQSPVLSDYWVDDIESFSVAVWVRAEYGTIVENQSANQPFKLWTGRVDIGSDCDGCNAYDDLSAFPRPDHTKWTHLVFAYDNQTNRDGLYINGVKFDNINFSGSPFTPRLNQRLKIGQLLQGYVDDVRLYNRPLSQADAIYLYQTTVPQLQFEFEESTLTNTFADQSNNEYDGTIVNAIPGLAGRIGNGVVLDGSSHVDVGLAPNINGLTNTLTIMTWVRPDQINNKTKLLVGSGLENSVDGFSFGMKNDGLWLSDGTTTISSGSIGLTANSWQHVAATLDAYGLVKFYLDGDQIGGTGTVSITANGDDNLYLGGRPLANATFGQYFSGQMDELYIYSRRMAATEIESSYNNQFRWFRKQFDTYLTVDNDVPTITLQTTEQYWPNDYIQLAVGTTDATSAIWSFEFGLQAPGETELTWQSAPACADVSFGTMWCPYFDPTTMAGEGDYQLQFRAVDSVGNETLSPIYSLYVDDSAPIVTSSDSGSWRNLTPDPDTELGWTLSLSGSVSDPTLVGGISGSGVYTPSVTVQVLNQFDTPLGQPQLATVNGTDWSLDYAFVGKPTGRYHLQITAADNVGNSAITTFNPSSSPLVGEGELLLDVRPPSVDSSDWLLPMYVISQPLTLSGTTTELPTGGNTLARYHFEEASSTAVYDHSSLDNHATCTNCPAPVTGLFGQAYSFDGINDTIDTPYLFNPMTTTFSIALWFNADSAGTGWDALVQQENGTGTGRTLLYLNNAHKLGTNLGGVSQIAATTVSTDEWHHAALTYDGTTARIYLDGRLDWQGDVTAETATGGLNLGSRRNLIDFFLGEMDEIMIFERVLSESEIQALATSDSAGVNGVEVWTEPFRFDSSPTTPDWQAAVVNSPLSGLSIWEYNLPTDLEDFYQIKVRGTDDFGNSSRENIIWRGIIDMVAPTLTLSATHLGGGSAAQTEISFTTTDPFLDLANLDLPCAPTTLNYSTYEADTVRADGITATCRIPGHELNPITAQVCDLAGHCVTDSVTLSPSPQISSVAILSPSHNITISGTQLIIPVSGTAYDPDGIEAVALSVNGKPLGQMTIGGAATDAPWTINGWQPQWSGTYTLTAVMTDTHNTTVTDTTNVHIEAHNCFTEIDGDNLTDFRSSDAAALQKAIDNAPINSTIKVAGLCANVSDGVVEAQVVAIAKSLTIVGGYAVSGDWSTAAPDLNETVWHGMGNGRVVSITNDSTVTLQNLTITGGHVADKGGGLYQMGGTAVLDHILVRDNYSDFNGGGIFVEDGAMTISHSQVLSNTAVNYGGGLAIINNNTTLTMSHTLVAHNAGDSGGGLYANSETTIYASTFHANEASIPAFGSGGGLFYGSATNSMTIEGSSFTDNSAYYGGGLYATTAGSGSWTMINSTVSNNYALNTAGVRANADSTILYSTIVSNTNGGGAYFLGGWMLTGTIIANNSGQECRSNTVVPIDGGYNLTADNTCGLSASTSMTNTDPLLLPLADNGGETRTHLPQAGSPVLNVIPVNVADCGTSLTTDQRGDPRPRGMGCEMGAVEVWVNSAPVALSDTFTATEDVTLTSATPGVLANDSDADGQGLTSVLDTSTSQGTLELASNGTFTYTGFTNFCGTDEFSYHADDGSLPSSPVTVTLDVACVNDAPIATANTFTVTEDSLNNLLNVLADDSDIEGDSLLISEIGILSAGGTAVNNTTSIDYTPAPNFFGTETFTYTLSDGNGGEDTAVVTVNVTPINDAPIAASDIYTTSEDLPLVINAPGVLFNDVDVDSPVLTATLLTDVMSGTLALAADASFTYTPDEDVCGSDQFTYEVTDGLATDATTVLLTIVCLPPIAHAGGPYLVDEGDSVLLDGSGSAQLMPSFLPGELTYEWDFDYDGSSFNVDGAGITTTLSAVSLDGPDWFIIGLRVTDGLGLTDTVTTTLMVENVAPTITAVANSSPITIIESATISVTATDPIDDLTYAFDCDDDGLFEVGPQASSSTACSFTTVGDHAVNVQVSDGDGGLVTDATTVTVINTAPTADAGEGYEVYEGESIILDASGSTDLEQDPTTLAYAWDFDGDGAHDDATGVMPTFSALTLDGPMSVTVGLQVMDDGDLVGVATAVVSILDQVPTNTANIYLPFVIGGN